MWSHRHAFYGFGFGMSPFGFFRGWRPFPSRSEYLWMLERYKQDLEAELRGVEREIEDLKKDSAA